MKLSTLKPIVQLLKCTRIPTMGDAPGTRIRGSALQAIRLKQYRTQPFCVRCLEQGKHRPYDEIDHIVPIALGGQDVPENRRPLCHECHKIVTRQQFGIDNSSASTHG